MLSNLVDVCVHVHVRVRGRGRGRACGRVYVVLLTPFVKLVSFLFFLKRVYYKSSSSPSSSSSSMVAPSPAAAGVSNIPVSRSPNVGRFSFGGAMLFMSSNAPAPPPTPNEPIDDPLVKREGPLPKPLLEDLPIGLE